MAWSAHAVNRMRLLFTFDAPVTRRLYVVNGLALIAVKYWVDVTLVRLLAQEWWALWDYARPVPKLWPEGLNGAHPALVVLLSVWALPFLWIGITMSARRALDAGLSAWWSLAFLVPGLNYVLMAALSVLPSRERRPLTVRVSSDRRRLPRVLRAIALGAGIGLVLLLVSVYAFRSYGIALFFATPFVVGALSAYSFNRGHAATIHDTIEVETVAIALLAGVVLLGAIEGAVCIAMALPLAFVVGAMGAAIGRQIALTDPHAARNSLVAVAVIPLTAVVETRIPVPAPREVRSSVIIAAAPAVVWRNVIAFPPLPPPNELLFRTGIAYPLSARLDGAGLGAVRYCEFSTGAFVEPITTWDPGHRLSFDVVRDPPPLREWSPYLGLHPPHLDGYFRARRGEFRLIALADGRTRLEGSTWYELRVRPFGYWAPMADVLVRTIHERVLKHIKSVAEAGA
jgi:uncharacterized membrane protein YhaH (DUF805 family)